MEHKETEENAMKKYTDMSLQERQAEYAAVQAEYEKLKAMGLSLNMARGKPSKVQLDLVTPIFSLLTKPEDFVSDGIDVRNYGEVAGIPAARRLFADILGCKPEQVFVGGNASLQLMYDAVSKAFTNGLLHSEKPWCKLDKVKWICPVPGYDRHFKVTESFGVEMISVPMTADGPDMDQVETLIKDPAVKGMWNVPKYSNPEGVIYSAATIDRLAKMKPAAPDFMLMWDNAYCIHEFDCDYVEFPDIISLCAKYGNATWSTSSPPPARSPSPVPAWASWHPAPTTSPTSPSSSTSRPSASTRSTSCATFCS